MNNATTDTILIEAVRAFRAEQWDVAKQLCLNILQQFPNDADALNLLAAVSFQQQDRQLALHLSSKAAALAPQNVIIQLGRAEILIALEMYEEALLAADNILALDADLPKAYLYRGISLTYLFRFGEARIALDKALALDASLDYTVNCNLVVLLAEQGRYESAHKLAIKVSENEPNDSGIAWLRNRYSLHTHSISRSEEKALAQALWRSDTVQRVSVHNSRTKGASDVLRIGYLSADVNRHPVSIFLKPIIETRNRSKFFAKLYDVSPYKDASSEGFRSLFDGCHDGLADSDQQLADAILNDGIDILVDVSGLHKGGRTSVLRHKPAPVQASWIGYSGTTGLAETDYVIADRFVCPEGSEDDFVERIIRLPNHYLCFEPPDVAAWPSEAPAIKNRKVSFGSFNNTVKLNLEVIRVWATILNRVPGSTLFLKSNRLKSLDMKEHVAQQFESFGIDRKRLILKGFVGWNHHFAAYNDIDIALDPFPYCGTTTTAEALWMSVPVITLVGERWIQRTSYGFLSGIGCDELCAFSESDYIERACALANDIDRISEYKKRLRPALLESPICDVQSFTRDLEHAYQNMWNTYVSAKAQG